MYVLGLAQTTDFLAFGGSFFARRAKKEPPKEESTMLPQATAAFA
jgi:hypothetical protein